MVKLDSPLGETTCIAVEEWVNSDSSMEKQTSQTELQTSSLLDQGKQDSPFLVKRNSLSLPLPHSPVKLQLHSTVLTLQALLWKETYIKWFLYKMSMRKFRDLWQPIGDTIGEFYFSGIFKFGLILSMGSNYDSPSILICTHNISVAPTPKSDSSPYPISVWS